MSASVDGPVVGMSRVWLRQSAAVALGVILAAAMVVLGVWQLDVYQRQGSEAAAQRAAGDPVPLGAVAPAGSTVQDGFGRRVSFTGTYDPALQLLVPTGAGFRVLTGLHQPDGSVVAVVRGSESAPDQPVPPAGQVTGVGVLLPAEETTGPAVTLPEEQIAAVQLPVLAQRWPGPLVGGFVTLEADQSVAQGLQPTAVALPEAQGRLRNGAYALQWWVFAAFALGMSIRVARDIGRLEERDADVGTTT